MLIHKVVCITFHTSVNDNKATTEALGTRLRTSIWQTDLSVVIGLGLSVYQISARCDSIVTERV